jgi:ABC-type nickel/cobalt efflux system permease component RcnA
MPVLASSLAASLSLCGGWVVLLGSLLVGASLSPSYKEYEMDAKTGAVGTLVIGIGVVVSFLGATPRLIKESHDATSISVGAALVVGFTLIYVFSRPIRMKRKIVTDHDEHEADEGQTHHDRPADGHHADAPHAVAGPDDEHTSHSPDADQDVRSGVTEPLP